MPDKDKVIPNVGNASITLAEQQEENIPMTLNKFGTKWVGAIPLPFYGLRKVCWCGEKFWTEKGYRGHYALCHILELE